MEKATIDAVCDIREDGTCRYGRALEIDVLPCCRIPDGSMCYQYRKETDDYCKFDETPEDCDLYLCGFAWRFIELSGNQEWISELELLKEQKRQKIRDKLKRKEYSGNPYPCKFEAEEEEETE